MTCPMFRHVAGQENIACLGGLAFASPMAIKIACRIRATTQESSKRLEHYRFAVVSDAHKRAARIFCSFALGS